MPLRLTERKARAGERQSRAGIEEGAGGKHRLAVAANC